MANRPTIMIYTDGGADPNPGRGGWGAVVIPPKGQRREMSGGEKFTTNNRMEMTAAIEALSSLEVPHVVDLHTDSQYLRNGISKWIHGWKRRGWKKADGEPVLNEDLWRRLDELTSKHQVRWHWVRGHSGHRWNERADQLATEGRLRGIAERRAKKKSKSKKKKADVHEAAPAEVPVETPAKEIPEGAAQVYLKVCAKKGREGWAVGIRGLPKSRVLADGAPKASSNLLGLLAVIQALEVIPKDQPVVIYASNDYLRLGATQWIVGWKKRGWKTKEKKPVANREAWARLDRLQSERRIIWEDIREEDIPKADLLDSLARQAGELKSKKA